MGEAILLVHTGCALKTVKGTIVRTLFSYVNWRERSYIAVMVTISITADAFEAIKAALEPGESYSDVIVRMASAHAETTSPGNNV